jgi:hypothetical protein
MYPVKTYKVLTEDLERVMTYPELVKVRQTDFTLPQYRQCLNAIADQFDLKPSVFERY